MGMGVDPNGLRNGPRMGLGVSRARDTVHGESWTK